MRRIKFIFIYIKTVLLHLLTTCLKIFQEWQQESAVLLHGRVSERPSRKWENENDCFWDIRLLLHVFVYLIVCCFGSDSSRGDSCLFKVTFVTGCTTSRVCLTDWCATFKTLFFEPDGSLFIHLDMFSHLQRSRLQKANSWASHRFYSVASFLCRIGIVSLEMCDAVILWLITKSCFAHVTRRRGNVTTPSD